MTPGVYITVDVECSMGGAWDCDQLRPVPPSRGMMGQYGDRAFGVPLIVQILREYGLAGTFFLEPFNDELGHPDQTEPVCRFLLDRGQDIQLHVHPNHVHYGQKLRGEAYVTCDQIGELEGQQQEELVRAGIERLQSYTGRKPVAFRAGNMGASEETLGHLSEAGICIDSSYAFPFAGGQCLFPAGEPWNGSRWYGDVLEVALSGYYQPRCPGLHAAKPLDFVGISAGEMIEAIEKIAAVGAETVLILHSFSLMKVRDLQYNRGRLNRIVAGRLRKVCRWLSGRSDLEVRTFAGLSDLVASGDFTARAVTPCRLGRPVRALARKALQGWNNLYWS